MVTWRVALGFSVAILGTLFVPVAGEVVNPQAEAPDSAGSAVTDLVGTNSCSARGCHGRIEPVASQRIEQNEYTIWVTEDKHALAYEALFGELSQGIIKKLGGNSPAHKDNRCIACHTNPLAVLSTPATTNDERLAGVGCEACHGAAKKWLGAHTTSDWKRKSAAEKRREGMTPPGELTDFAQQCVGCHIGAAANAAQALPLRDMNHDLIAAGHPRLNFELGVFLANMPRHWGKQIEAGRPKDFEAKVWIQGQLVSAHAALKLLGNRAETAKIHADRPWPEFSEYDCYACHHDLRQPSRRQNQEHYDGRRPGTLPWGSWYFAMPRQLANKGAQANPGVAALLANLKREMEKPIPDPAQVAKHAREAAAGIQKWLQSGIALDVARLRETVLSFGNDWENATNSWDTAEQLYLGLCALNECQHDAQIQKSLHGLSQWLVFPAGKGTQDYNSPMSFDIDQDKLQKQLKEIRKQLNK